MHNYTKGNVGHDLLSTYYARALPFPPSLTCFCIQGIYFLQAYPITYLMFLFMVGRRLSPPQPDCKSRRAEYFFTHGFLF